MRSIVGHHRLTSGRVAFEGKALDRSAAHDRARSGIAFVPQGREMFPLLTVRENLETGFAPLRRADRNIPGDVFELFPVLEQMLSRQAAIFAVAGSSWRSGGPWSCGGSCSYWTSLPKVFSH